MPLMESVRGFLGSLNLVSTASPLSLVSSLGTVFLLLVCRPLLVEMHSSAPHATVPPQSSDERVAGLQWLCSYVRQVTDEFR